jgi:hypothetical protein
MLVDMEFDIDIVRFCSDIVFKLPKSNTRYLLRVISEYRHTSDSLSRNMRISVPLLQSEYLLLDVVYFICITQLSQFPIINGNVLPSCLPWRGCRLFSSFIQTWTIFCYRFVSWCRGTLISVVQFFYTNLNRILLPISYMMWRYSFPNFLSWYPRTIHRC